MRNFTLLITLLCFCFTASNAQNTILHLSFNDSSLIDSSANNFIGTAYDIVYTEGSCNSTGIYVNGSVTNNFASSVQISDSSILRPSADFTLSAWAMYTDSSQSITYPYVVAKRYSFSSAPFDSYGLFIDNSGSQGSYWTAVIGDSLGQHLVASVSEAEIGEWTHLALVFENNNLALYVNGQQENNMNLQPADIMYSNLPFSVGTSRGNGTNTQFEGNIDEVYLFDYALSSTEVGDLASCPIISNNQQFKAPSSKIKLFPNPALHSINIEVEKQGIYSIVSVLGERLQSFQLNGGRHSIDLHQLPSGLYFLQSEDGESLKFVKQ
jgi:hypothetical protein